MMACDLSSYISCEDLASDGPHVAFSSGCLLNSVLYVHGGVSEARSTKPNSNLYRILLDKRFGDDNGSSCKNLGRWELANSSGPALSHHTCTPVDDIHIVYIGICCTRSSFVKLVIHKVWSCRSIMNSLLHDGLWLL